MPHVIVKLWPGKTVEQKQALAETITRGVMEHLKYGEESVSVAFEEISPDRWSDQVYRPDILGKWPMLVKQPGYGRRPA